MNFTIDKIFQSTDQLTVLLILEIMGAGLLCGILFALMYMFINRTEGYA